MIVEFSFGKSVVEIIFPAPEEESTPTQNYNEKNVSNNYFFPFVFRKWNCVNN